MAVSKVTLNGSTLMDTTGVTVDESNLLTGNTALDNSGTLITGTATAGVNIPTFTVTTDASYETVTSIACDKSYSECYDLMHSLNGWARFNIIDPSNPDDPYLTLNFAYREGDIYLKYIGVDIVVGGLCDIIYYSNGTIEASYDSEVSGTEGTPTATKGTVSNHSVSVTPSVTNARGFIDGGSHTGTAVTVTASELDSGTKSISANGTGIDVVGYAAVDVAVPTHKLTVTGDSGGYVTYKGTDYAAGTDFSYTPGETCNVQVSGYTYSYIYLNGTLVVSKKRSPANYNYTLPFNNADVRISRVGNGDKVTAYITPKTLSITSRGEYNVNDYAVADVNIIGTRAYTATVTVTSDTGFQKRSYVTYNDTLYKSADATFTFHSGEKCIMCAYGEMVGGSVYVDGIKVADTDYAASTIAYTYYLPENDISILLYSGSGGRIDVTNIEPIDLPIFTLTGDYATEVTTITCNKTFTECEALVNSGYNPTDNWAALYKEIWSNNGVSDSETGFLGLNAHYRQSGNTEYIDYYGTESGIPFVKITYDSDGNLNYTYDNLPTDQTLNVTENGTYTAPYNRRYKTVNVNVSGGGGGAISITDVVDPVTGGTARYINAVDISDTTAVAADVAQGKYFYTAAGIKTAGASSGGGSAVESGVVFYDYDGAIVNSYTAQEAQALTELPANPTHTGLVAQGWNWSLADIKSYLHDYPDGIVNVGQMYITQSGATEIDVTFDDANFLSPYLAIAPNGTVVVDWGDGSATDTVTGTSLTTLKYTQHVYSQTGSYMIKLTVSSGSFAFFGNNNYTSVLRAINAANNRTRNRTYGGCITAIRLGSNVSIGPNAFYNCYCIVSITIPDGVTTIDGNAFAYCYSLKSLTIPDGIASIGGGVFFGCYSLASVTIPDTVTSIVNGAFYYCYSLASVTIPDGVTIIDSNVFNSCYSLASLVIPDGVTSIGSNSFQYCYSLTSVTIPDTVTSIGSSVFNGCYSLASVTIPDEVTSIDSNTFQNCSALTSVTIPDGVTSIGNSAFYNCYALTSVTIPDTVISIGSGVFYNCYSLASVTIPDGVTTIGTNAFNACHSLTSVTIPDTVISIGNTAFSSSYAIEEYHFLQTTPPTLGTSAFNGIMTGTKIYVPYSADHSILAAYQTASNWSTYASYMEEEPN